MARATANGRTRSLASLGLLFASVLLAAALAACGSASSAALGAAERDLESLKAPTAEQAASLLGTGTLEKLEADGIDPEAYLGALFQKSEFEDFSAELGASDDSAVVSFTATAVDLDWARSEIASRVLAMESDGGAEARGSALVMEVLGADDAPTVTEGESVAMERSEGAWAPQAPEAFLAAALAGQSLSDLLGAA